MTGAGRPETAVPWRERVTEHAQMMSGGGMNIRADYPDLEGIYPLADWIQHNTRNGGRVFRRVIIVVEDWTEVTP